jgi:hypothetical protein
MIGNFRPFFYVGFKTELRGLLCRRSSHCSPSCADVKYKAQQGLQKYGLYSRNSVVVPGTLFSNTSFAYIVKRFEEIHEFFLEPYERSVQAYLRSENAQIHSVYFVDVIMATQCHNGYGGNDPFLAPDYKSTTPPTYYLGDPLIFTWFVGIQSTWNDLKSVVCSLRLYHLADSFEVMTILGMLVSASRIWICNKAVGANNRTKASSLRSTTLRSWFHKLRSLQQYLRDLQLGYPV